MDHSQFLENMGIKPTVITSGKFKGEGNPFMPVEVNREAKQGNGGGINEIGERKTWLLHPFGFADTGTPASESYTLAELRLAATWNRVTQSRKTIPMAYLITN